MVNKLAEIARPGDAGAGYDYPAIARALSLPQRMTLAIVDAGRGEQVDDGRVLQQLAEAGLVVLVGGRPPDLSMLGAEVVAALALLAS